MDAVKVGEQALVGWREKVADGAAKPFESRTKVQPDQVRALVGGVFFVLSLYYVISTARRAVREARQG
jgi:hypothetical protein